MHIVCKRVMDATSSVLCVEDVPLKMLLHFVSTLPREFTDFGGEMINFHVIKSF